MDLRGQSGEQQAGPRETTSVVSTPRKAGGKSGKKGGRRKKGDMGSADGASAESLGGLGESHPTELRFRRMLNPRLPVRI